MPGSLFQMVGQVLADSRAKIAHEKLASAGLAAAPRQSPRPQPAENEKKAQMLLHSEKIAGALEALADNLHLVEDQRSPQEKLAEYHAIHEALRKQAEQGDESKGPHQHEEANHDSISPMNPPMDSGVNPGGPDSAMKAAPNTATGTTPEPGSQGQATEDQIPPTHISPTEHNYPTDGGNALETNYSHQPGKGGHPIDKIAQARAQHLAQMVARGGIRKEAAAFIVARDQALVKQAYAAAGILAPGPKQAPPAQRANGDSVVDDTKTAGFAPGPQQGLGTVLEQRKRPLGYQLLDAMTAPKTAQAKMAAAVKDAVARGVPEKLAEAYVKFAFQGEGDDAHIQAGTTPELQSVPGISSALMQGTEAGQQVPDQKGSDSGRQLISDNEAAINATPNEAHGRMVRSEMGRYLNEPAMSAAHDKTLQQSLDNTSSAGVKIAATRALLQKWASQSPENRQKLAAAMLKVKKANEAAGYGAPPGADVPGSSGPTGTPGMTNPGGSSMPMPGMDAGAAAADGGVPPGADPTGGMGGAPGGGEAGVPDSALAAAAEGVTPEELAMAEAMLAQQMGAGGAPGGMPPPGGMPMGEEQPAPGMGAPAAAPGEGAGAPPAGAPKAS